MGRIGERVPSKALDHDHVKVDNKFSRVRQLVITCYNSSSLVIYKRVTSLLKPHLTLGGVMKRKKSELPFRHVNSIDGRAVSPFHFCTWSHRRKQLTLIIPIWPRFPVLFPH